MFFNPQKKEHSGWRRGGNWRLGTRQRPRPVWASFGPKLYHAGIRQPTACNTLAVANEKRDWRIFADFAQMLIQQTTALCADEPFRYLPGKLNQDARFLRPTQRQGHCKRSHYEQRFAAL